MPNSLYKHKAILIEITVPEEISAFKTNIFQMETSAKSSQYKCVLCMQATCLTARQWTGLATPSTIRRPLDQIHTLRVLRYPVLTSSIPWATCRMAHRWTLQAMLWTTLRQCSQTCTLPAPYCHHPTTMPTWATWWMERTWPLLVICLCRVRPQLHRCRLHQHRSRHPHLLRHQPLFRHHHQWQQHHQCQGMWCMASSSLTRFRRMHVWIWSSSTMWVSWLDVQA